MAETPIPPALTPGQWESAIRDRAGMAEAIQRAWGDDSTRGNDHALAALCLYGQPFGFTHEDVAVLTLARYAIGMGYGDFADMERVESLATRIAALLPPTPADGGETP